MCLLASIAEQESYGYAIVRDLNSWGLEIRSERSIYPPLKRLEANGYVESNLQPSPDGPARKYYSITPEGQAKLTQWVDEWVEVRIGVDAVISSQVVKK